MSSLYVGMGPPYVVRATIAKSPDFDPLQAAGASPIVFVVRKSTGAVVEWAATVQAASSASITLEHALALGDLDVHGSWRLWARFTLGGGGELRTNAIALPEILERNQVSP